MKSLFRTVPALGSLLVPLLFAPALAGEGVNLNPYQSLVDSGTFTPGSGGSPGSGSDASIVDIAVVPGGTQCQGDCSAEWRRPPLCADVAPAGYLGPIIDMQSTDEDASCYVARGEGEETDNWGEPPGGSQMPGESD